MPEEEMQMAADVFELAGAHKLIGKHFIAPNYSIVGFQLVVESILISNSEGAQFASTIFRAFKFIRAPQGARAYP